MNVTILGIVLSFSIIAILIYLGLQPSEERTLIINQSTGGNGTVTSVNAGAFISVNQTTGNVLVNNTRPENTTGFNIGAGQEIWWGEFPNDRQNFKGLLGGDGIVLTDLGFDIQINATGQECVNLGSVGNSLCVAPNSFKKLLAGSGISFSDNGTRITITNISPESTACTDSGSGVALCNGGNININSLIAGERMYITNTGGDLTITNAEVGQLLTNVRQQLTKTNLPTTFTDIYTASFDVEDIAGGNTNISFTNSTKFRIYYTWDFVGAGTDRLRWTNNGANVLYDTGTFTGNCDPCNSGWLPLPSWVTSLGGARDTPLKWQGLSSNGTNDPIAYGYVIYVK